MNSDNPVYAGVVLSGLAVLGNTTLLETLLTTAALLAGIAGPKAALEGPGGELIRPGFNLITTGRDIPTSRRLREVLIDPIAAVQRDSRDLAHSLSQERLDFLQYNHHRDQTQSILESARQLTLHPLTPGPDSGKAEVERYRHPTSLLRSPDLTTLEKALAETLDGSPLILSDTLFDDLRRRGRKELKAVAGSLAALLGGQERHLTGADPRLGPGRIALFRAHLVASTTRNLLQSHLEQGESAVLQILRHSVLLDSETLPPLRGKMEVEDIRSGYRTYHAWIKRVIDARQKGSGLQWQLSPQTAQEMIEFTQELQKELAEVPDRVRPFFSDALNLPYRLLWAGMTLQTRDEAPGTLPLIKLMTRKLVKSQKVFLCSLLQDMDAQRHRKARILMLRKLMERPCVFRNLLRRYSTQRRELHEPLLNELIAEGLVRLREDKHLEISERGREELGS